MRTVVVTGAGSGIGLAVAKRLLIEGWDVVAVDLDVSALAAEAADAAVPLRTVVGDVRRRETHDRARQSALEAGTLEAWVAVAGITRSHELTALEETSAREVFDVNGFGTLWSAASAVSQFVDDGTPGVFIGISSVHARFAAPHYPVYEMTKASVEALIRSIAVSYGAAGIRAVGIAPGAVDTPALRQSLDADPDGRHRLDELHDRSPLHRIGDVDEVAAAVSFALSDAAAFVSGTTIVVDGGWTASLQLGTRPSGQQP